MIKTLLSTLLAALLTSGTSPEALAQSSPSSSQSGGYGPAGPPSLRAGDAGPALERPLRFAFIGDYGLAGVPLQETAAIIDSWEPEFIITSGDNNYPDGEAATIDANLGQYFHQWIHPYVGTYGEGANRNRFFPSIGNHDWHDTLGFQPYLDYLELPGNERYFRFRWNRSKRVEFFCINSDINEPDGVSDTSIQAQWLQSALASSTATFKIVYFHHAQYSSGVNGPTAYMDWPFHTWDVDLVLTGHDHHYERVFRNNLTVVINGLGGAEIRPIGSPVQGSEFRFNSDYGAMLGVVQDDLLTLSFITRDGTVIDEYSITAEGVNIDQLAYVASGDDWKFLDDGSDQGVAWYDPVYVDAAWSVGPSELGYGDGDEATEVEYGPDPNNKYITTYFRKTFDVPDPGAVSSLRLRLKRDDGAVVYLNGTEIRRSNMPAGAITYTTLASSSAGGSEDIFLDFDVDHELLVPGDNVVAAEVHQSVVDSPDLTFDLELIASLGRELVPLGSDWKYLDDGTRPANWTHTTFDASTWLEGPAQLGYGDGDEATVVGFGPDQNNKYITTHFRHEFNVPDASIFTGLLLQITRDDGVVVYINGQRVYRNNLPDGPIDENSLARFAISSGDEDAVYQTSIDPGALQDGTNVIAVEVHQWDDGSDDLSFDAGLLGIE